MKFDFFIYGHIEISMCQVTKKNDFLFFCRVRFTYRFTALYIVKSQQIISDVTKMLHFMFDTYNVGK